MTRKIASIAMGAALMCATAQADLEFGNFSPFGIFYGAAPISSGMNVSYQIMWSPDSDTIADDGSITLAEASAGAGTQADGEDYVLVNGTVSQAVGGFPVPEVHNANNSDVGGADILTGNLYGVLYIDTDTSAGISLGDEYGIGPVVALDGTWDRDLGDPTRPPPNSYDWNAGSAFTVPDDGSAPVVVPEPGTMALFALGLATIAWRRRKK